MSTESDPTIADQVGESITALQEAVEDITARLHELADNVLTEIRDALTAASTRIDAALENDDETIEPATE